MLLIIQTIKDKTKVNGIDYNVDKAKQNLLKIGTKKISKNEAHDLYDSLIEPALLR